MTETERSERGIIFETSAVARYRTPRYPRHGWTIPPAIGPRPWPDLPLGKIAMALAGGALTTAASGCWFAMPGEPAMECLAEVSLDEADARQRLLDGFTTRGYTITEDLAFEQDGVSFTADGYDPTARVGYEALSPEDSADELPPAEEVLLIDWSKADGPYFLIYSHETDCQWDYEADDAAARERLRANLEAQIQTFLDAMETNGHL